MNYQFEKMNINRQNYEEFFLLYTDNELSAAERQAVELFVQHNPDLEQEFSLMRQSTLTPDDSVVFTNKESLLRHSSVEGFIHHENCQELFILYADDELANDQNTAVEKFVYDHPQYQEEFELLQSLKLSADLSITFPDKKKLYHLEKNKRAVILSWGRVASAAVVLLLTGLFWLSLHHSVKPSNDVAKSVKNHPLKTKADEKDSGYARVPSGGLNRYSLPQKPAPDMIPKHQEKQDEQDQQAASVATGLHPKLRRPQIHKNELQDVRPESRELAQSSARTKNPVSSVIRNEKQQEPEFQDPASEAKNPSSKKILDEITGQPELTKLVSNHVSERTEDVILTSGNTSDNVIFTGISFEKKSTIRGLLRKASRLIDKNTALRPAKRSGLVIGNIEIAFQ